jgi:hypothetical protein
LRPIFRDREDFSAGHSLTAQTLAALEASEFLIVLCSPAVAQSTYVNEEIRRFKTMERADHLIPVSYVRALDCVVLFSNGDVRTGLAEAVRRQPRLEYIVNQG